MGIELGRVGIWQRELRFHEDRGAAADAAAELEDLGFSALWVRDAGGDPFAAVEQLLAATRAVRVPTIEDRVAADVAAGADHVCLQVVGADGRFPYEEWRRLAPALSG